MSKITATAARNRFGQFLEMAQAGPVNVQKNGRDVAVLLSPAEFRRLQQNGASRVNPRLELLIDESMEQRDAIYKALAK